MVVADKVLVNVVKDLENYFKVPKKIKRANELAEGIGTTALNLVSLSNQTNTVGSNELENALVYQWLEYASLYSPFLNKSQLVVHQVLKELNDVLTKHLFLVNNKQTVADVVLFYLLWNIVSSMSFQEKEQYISLSRWFNTLQQDDELRQSKSLVCFSRTLLYQ